MQGGKAQPELCSSTIFLWNLFQFGIITTDSVGLSEHRARGQRTSLSQTAAKYSDYQSNHEGAIAPSWLNLGQVLPSSFALNDLSYWLSFTHVYFQLHLFEEKTQDQKGCHLKCIMLWIIHPFHATRYHTIACSCARTLIYWSVFQSTIVRLFACYTERNVNQCFLNGSVVRQWTCSTKRYERERKREREGQRERERLQKGCAQIVQCTLVMFMPKPQMLYVYIA